MCKYGLAHGNASHGMSRTKEHHAWAMMKGRCYNRNATSFADYGGRGIAVAPEWMKFEAFLADMGMAPSPRHSLDRIDPNGDYCKVNCRWATAAEQANNRRSTVLLHAFGETKSLREWSRDHRCAVTPGAIAGRIRRGLDAEAAITLPAYASGVYATN